MLLLLLAFLFSTNATTINVLLGGDTLHLPAKLFARDARGIVLDAPRIAIGDEAHPWLDRSDTLIGPIVLDATRGPMPRIPDGTRIRMQGNVTSSPPSLWLQDDQSCHGRTVQ